MEGSCQGSWGRAKALPNCQERYMQGSAWGDDCEAGSSKCSSHLCNGDAFLRVLNRMRLSEDQVLCRELRRALVVIHHLQSRAGATRPCLMMRIAVKSEL